MRYDRIKPESSKETGFSLCLRYSMGRAVRYQFQPHPFFCPTRSHYPHIIKGCPFGVGLSARSTAPEEDRRSQFTAPSPQSATHRGSQYPSDRQAAPHPIEMYGYQTTVALHCAGGLPVQCNTIFPAAFV